MHPFDHLLFFTIAVLFPLRSALVGFRRLRNASDADVPRVRLWLYRQAIVVQWSLAIGMLLLWAWRHRSWTTLLLAPRLTPGLIGVLSGLVFIVILVARQRATLLADRSGRELVRGRLRKLERLMPRSVEDVRWFAALAVTAGICEELLYRGFVFWYLGHWLDPWQTLAASALLFGLGHAYQGVRGVLTTGALGAFLGGVVLVSVSLYPAMVIHALMDLHTGTLARRVYQHDDEDARTAALVGAPAAGST